MGKGDKKSKKGKRLAGTFGVHRPRTAKKAAAVVTPKAKKKATAKKIVAAKVTPAAEVEETKVAATPEAKAPAKKVSTKGDDLTKIEGVGPKVKEVLTEAGLGTFADVAKTEATKIGEILIAANSRYKMFDPTSWPEQAQLAADGKWDELKTLQDALDGGKAK